MARCRASVARSRTFLSHAVTPPSARRLPICYQRGIRSPELIEHMRIGYAPGGCLRGWLTQLGYPLAGSASGRPGDRRGIRRIRASDRLPAGRQPLWPQPFAAAPPHRFLPGAKGGLYAWEQARPYPEVILVEGLFDYAVLWQAGFHNVTCSLGTHLNAHQFRQLCDGSANRLSGL